MKSLIFLLVALAYVATAQAQTNISGTINAYTAVTAVDADNCQITVSGTTGFAIGDQAIMIQMKGATIDQTNTNAYGDINPASNIGDAGNYEIVTITNIVGNLITLAAKPAKTYTVSGLVQLVSFPSYTNANINGTLTGQAWNGTTGGVIALQVTGTLSFAANIDAKGIGFRRGAVSANGCQTCCNISPIPVVTVLGSDLCSVGVPVISAPAACGTGSVGVNSYFYAAGSVQGGGKGEGISITPTNHENGFGKMANGGGGGNCHNFGGGGGGNSGAGGQGGDRASGCTCPSGCCGAATDDNGRPGLTLSTYFGSGKIFLGGGGGGGHQNNSTGLAEGSNPTLTGASPGGNGGGVVIIRAGSLTGAGFTIDARGNAPAFRASADAAGGGGAGGTVLLDVTAYTGNINVNVAGGDGGHSNNGANNTTPLLGPGGGGGGGLVWVSAGAVPANVVPTLTGGAGGLSWTWNGVIANGATGTARGAAAGSAGSTRTSLSIPQGSVACSVFPIQLFRLSAYSTGKEVDLNWVLKGDDNYQTFALEREDNGSFAPIYTTAYSDAKKTYSYTDAQLISGVRKYRVTVTDIDGAVRHSNTVLAAPSDYAVEPTVTLFPNPVPRNETVAVSVDGMPVVKVQVYDLRGVLLYNALPNPTIPGLWELPIQQMGLSSGTYMVNIVGKSKTYYHKLVVVN